MKNLKKAPRKQLEKFSNIFMQIGLVLVLFVVYITMEYKTAEPTIPDCIFSTSELTPYVIDDIKPIIFTKATKPRPKVQAPPKPIFLDVIKKGEDDVIETILLDDILDDEPVDLVVIEPEIYIPEPIDNSEVPFINIEDAPVFKGCEGLSKKENKKCFEKNIRKFVQRNFNPNKAEEAGLSNGKYRISTQFVIDKQGKVIDIQIRAPHLKLKKEAKRVLDKLPKFTPGKQRKKPVNVRYQLPISFYVD